MRNGLRTKAVVWKVATLTGCDPSLRSSYRLSTSLMDSTTLFLFPGDVCERTLGEIGT